MMHIEQERSACAARAASFPVGRFGTVVLIMVGGLVAATSCGPTNPTNLDGVNGSGTKVPVWREAFDAEAIGFLSSVWGADSDNVFVVGGQSEQGTVHHFDGTSWSPMQVPSVPILVWVFGFGADDVYAVGEGGGIIHYDGVTWTSMDSPTDADLFGVWGTSSDDLWAVGGDIAAGPMTILHSDGGGWTEVATPVLDRNSTALLKVWGTSPISVFAVGQSGVILSFDGNVWSQVPSGTTEDLVTLWGSGPDHLVVVGGRSNGVVGVYDGTDWTTESRAGELVGLNGVFVTPSGESHVVGLLGTVARIDPNGIDITIESTPTALTLHGVWGDGAGRVYAVGGRSSEMPFIGVALVRTLE